MIRLAACIWSVVAIVLALTVFQIKFAVQGLEGELAGVNAEIVRDQEAIHVLRAEWSYLNRPDRIAGLAERFLGLDPAVEPQLVNLKDLDKLPLRLEGVVIRPADAGPLLPREKPDGLLYASAPAAPEEESEALQAVVRVEPAAPPPGAPKAENVSTGVASATSGGTAPFDPIAATLIKYGGAQ
ncbi:MAG: hypothetical protein P8X52_01765 [Limibacillus sp.]